MQRVCSSSSPLSPRQLPLSGFFNNLFRNRRPQKKPRKQSKTHVTSAAALIRQGRLQPAEDQLKKALALDSESSGAHLRLGNLYLKQHQLPLAQRHLEKASQLSPKDVNIINNLGTTYEQLGDYQRAIEEFKKAIQLMPSEAGGYNNLAWLYVTCPDTHYRDNQQAISLATKACELTGMEPVQPARYARYCQRRIGKLPRGGALASKSGRIFSCSKKSSPTTATRLLPSREIILDASAKIARGSRLVYGC